jgi:predicted heme/steroid binding protein/uncharacterized membrane protein
MKVYSREELAENNGQNGSNTLVAVDGKIYDLTTSKRWPGGGHMNRHKAGSDLSADIKAAPHGVEVLERFEQVGELQEAPAPAYEGLRGTVEDFLNRHPFFRRHPHPAAVHLPIGLIMGAFLFQIVALLLNSPKTEWASFCCLIVVTLTLPPVIVTGWLTWWVNYECVAGPVINWKRRLAYTAFVVALICVVLRLTISEPLNVSDPHTIAYCAALFALTAILSIVGYLGGLLTFPYE